MRAGDSLTEFPKKSRNWRFIGAVVAIGIALSAFMVIATIQGNCGLACGPPIDVPVIRNAYAMQSSLVTPCEITTQSDAIVCQIYASGRTSGTIIMNLTSQNGDSQVAFGLFSSSQNLHFNSTYSCLYSTAFPNYNNLRCPVLGTGSNYHFDFRVDQNVSAPEEVVLNIVVTKTCCWP